MGHDFRHMLVRQGQRIGEIGSGDRIVAARIFHLRDQLLATAGVAGHRIDRHGIIRGQQPCAHQGGDQGDCPGRIAARVGNELRAGDALSLAFGQLGKAESPVGIAPVGGRGVDEPRSGVGRECHRFPRGIVGQAQNGNVGFAQKPGPDSRIPPLLNRHRHQLDVAPFLQPRYDLQASCSVFTVNENLGSHRASPFMQILSGAYAALRIQFTKLLIRFASVIVVIGVLQAVPDNAWQQRLRLSR
jgi:hypothetical protein